MAGKTERPPRAGNAPMGYQGDVGAARGAVTGDLNRGGGPGQRPERGLEPDPKSEGSSPGPGQPKRRRKEEQF